MTTLLHLSDLHFGRVEATIEKALLEVLPTLGVDVSIVSGDLTQRARSTEFKSAAAFVAKLPAPQLVVPGNHDIPLYPLLRRFVSGLGRYERFITPELFPVIDLEDTIIVGINTARALALKNGRVSRSQIQYLKEIFRKEDSRFKVLVTHHPLHLLEPEPGEVVARRSDLAVEVLRDCGVDILLSGHYHRGASGVAAVRQESHYGAVLVACGTSLSNRYRGQSNSFNRLRLGPGEIGVDHYQWSTEKCLFEITLQTRFERSEGRWVAVS